MIVSVYIWFYNDPVIYVGKVNIKEIIFGDYYYFHSNQIHNIYNSTHEIYKIKYIDYDE